MLFAEVSVSTEEMVAVGTLLAAMGTAIGVMWRQNIANAAETRTQYDTQIVGLRAHYEAEIKRLTSDRNSWSEMATESVVRLETVAKNGPLIEGKLPEVIPPIAPIVPEHSSPVTPQQQQTADIGTLRARLVAATLALGLAPRLTAPPE